MQAFSQPGFSAAGETSPDVGSEPALGFVGPPEETGLGFDDEGLVTMNGLPFDQCSQAQKVRVGAAMAMAMNPNLRVILITDASLLDEDSKAAVNAMAAEKGFQVWYEVVGNPADATLILEDGSAVEAEVEAEKVGA